MFLVRRRPVRDNELMHPFPSDDDRCTLSRPRNVSNWNTKNVKKMNSMFRGATSADPDTSSWDTSNVEAMDFMFYGAVSARVTKTASWDMTKVTDVSSMFNGAV